MWKIAKKDIKVFFTDRKALFLTLLLPIGLITLFALAFGGVGRSDDAPSSVIVLFSDEDKSPSSKEIIAYLDSTPGMDLVAMEREEAMKEIKAGDHIANIIIYKGLEDSLDEGKDIPVELQFDRSRDMETGMLQNLLMGKLSAMKRTKDADKGIERMVESVFSQLPAASKDSMKTTIRSGMSAGEGEEKIITMTSVVGDEGSSWGLIQAVAGTAIMMLLFSVSAIGQSMLEEKESGVLKKLLQSPVKPYEIMLGKMMTATILSIFQLTIMFIFAWLAFGLNIFLNIPALITMIIVTALACSSFCVLLSSIVTTKKQA
ncbi:MAG: ABC transporter permease, partial [Chitinophagales bacterium]|nr:ABC transporter permease [Chitinophagales bacterium]